MGLGLFLASFFMYFSYHVVMSVKGTPVVKCSLSFLRCTVYVANFVRRRRTGTVSCSRDWLLVVKESGTAQLVDLVILSRHDSLTITIALKYSASCVRSFFVIMFNRANRLLISVMSRIDMSLALLAWQTGINHGVFLDTPLGFTRIELSFFASVALISLAKDLPPVTTPTFMTCVRSSATENFVFEESCKRSDIVRFKKL